MGGEGTAPRAVLEAVIEDGASNAANAARTVPPLPRQSSTPALPPVADNAWGTPVRRPPAQVPSREAFLSSLLNEDLQKVTKWHGTRPRHEQKRFLRSVSTLYKAFEERGGGPKAPSRAERQRQEEAEMMAAAAAAEANHRAAQAAALEDPLNGPPRDTPRGDMSSSASAPTLGAGAKPIDVFEQRKRKGLRARRNGEEDGNTLADWMDGMSISSQSTGTTAASQATRFSQLTMTSIGGSSICSEPGTTHHMQFRQHRRAFALNKNNWAAADPHHSGALKDGVPNIGFPTCERMHTNFQDNYGSANPPGNHITKQMYASVFQGDQHPFVSRFLEGASRDDKEQVAGLVRSLEYLRTAADKHKGSLQKQEMNLQENQRLWKPPRQRPMFDTSECNLSQIPLGTLTQPKKAKSTSTLHIPDSLPAYQPPPSPTVSGLGSLPLSRLTTPAVH
mmetsp:Transcript_94/g.239  ORF Transcript_94/g.239 Transcript_94/m.239 type:complete len:449 (+) Transcript_94:54-1400(+)